MPEKFSPEVRSRTMRSVKGKGTSLELRLWSLLDDLKLKNWRRNAEDVIGRPDAVFDAQKVAIFVDGCFWHGCKICNRPMPVINSKYWHNKISRNIKRDRKISRQLRKELWKVIRIKEHEFKGENHIKRVCSRILRAVKATASNQ
jgi:DNA mismatch endonuclease, patch repair protein